MKDVLRFFNKNKLKVMSTILALVISFLGIVLTVVLYYGTQNLKDNLEDKVQIAVFVEKTDTSNSNKKIDEAKKALLIKDIKNVDNVYKVKYKDANEELDKLINEVSGEEGDKDNTFEDIKKDNPLQDVVYVDIKDKTKVEITAEKIKDINRVELVEYNKDATKIYLKSLNLLVYLSIASVLSIVLLTFPILLILISSGIDMRRTELKIKKLVGASRLKILGNFIVEISIIFIVAFIITFIISKYIIDFIVSLIKDIGLDFLDLSHQTDILLNANLFVIIVGIILAVISIWYAFFVNRKYQN